MIGRIWRTQVLSDRADEYETFARDISLPMFRQQRGFEGVLMLRQGEECLVISLWRGKDDLAVLSGSPGYSETVAQIVARGFLFGEQTVDLFNVHLATLVTTEAPQRSRLS